MLSNASIARHLQVEQLFIKKILFEDAGFCTSSRGLPSSIGSSSPLRRWMQSSMPGIIGSPLGFSDLEYHTRHQTSPSAFGLFHQEEDIDLSSTSSLRSASSKTRSSHRWIFQLWSFLHPPLWTLLYISCWDRQQHGQRKDAKNRSIKDTRNYVKTQIGKNHEATHKSTIYQRDYRGEENPHNRSV